MYRIIGLEETDYGRYVIVEFSIRAKGNYAYLLGNFNAFNEGSFRMRKEDKDFKIEVKLPEGIWHYAYSIDGKYVLDEGERALYQRKSYNFSREVNVCRALYYGYEKPFHCASMLFPIGSMVEVRLRAVNSREAFLIHESKVRMEKFASDALFEYYRAVIPIPPRYHFEIDGKRYGDFGFENENKDNNKNWVYKTIFYQIMPSRFTGSSLDGGTLRGLLHKIEHIKGIGANALYLTPIFSSDTYHGYDIKDYYSINPKLGCEKDFIDLAKEMPVMVDGVFHHTSSAHPFFKDVLDKGKKSAYAGFYRPLSFPVEDYETFFNVRNMPRLNHESNEVYEFVRDVVKYWTERGAKAWRMDVAHGVPPEFWKKLKAEMKYARVYVCGEVMDDARSYMEGFDGFMNYSLYETILNFFVHNGKAEDFLSALQKISAHYNEKEYMMYNFLDNHDTSRFLGLVRSKKKYLCALAFLFTYKGLPSIFYGDEIGMKKRKGLIEGQREQMVWDKSRWDMGILKATKELIELRRENIALTRGSFEPILFEEKRILYKRKHLKDELLIGINYSRDRTEWPVEGDMLAGIDDGRGYSFFVMKSGVLTRAFSSEKV
jgi:glycosidase